MKVAEQLRQPVSVSENERDLLARLATTLEQGEAPVKLKTADGDEFSLPVAILSVLGEAASAMAAGDGVAVLSIQTELSPQQAARVLNVSRPYLIRLLDRGEIPFHRVGSHRRIVLSDLLAYGEQRDASRREELRRLSELSREIRIPE